MLTWFVSVLLPSTWFVYLPQTDGDLVRVSPVSTDVNVVRVCHVDLSTYVDWIHVSPVATAIDLFRNFSLNADVERERERETE